MGWTSQRGGAGPLIVRWTAPCSALHVSLRPSRFAPPFTFRSALHVSLTHFRARRAANTRFSTSRAVGVLLLHGNSLLGVVEAHAGLGLFVAVALPWLPFSSLFLGGIPLRNLAPRVLLASIPSTLPLGLFCTRSGILPPLAGAPGGGAGPPNV